MVSTYVEHLAFIYPHYETFFIESSSQGCIPKVWYNNTNNFCKICFVIIWKKQSYNEQKEVNNLCDCVEHIFLAHENSQ